MQSSESAAGGSSDMTGMSRVARGALVLAIDMLLALSGAAELRAGAPADLDRDDDVDLVDFAVFQACLSGPDVPSIQACVKARMDFDQDVDDQDLSAFVQCLSGTDIPASPACRGSERTYFPRASAWYTDVSDALVDTESSAVITWLAGAGGWGYGRMQIDFSIEVMDADATTPFRGFTTTDEFYFPDCDHQPVPVPPGGALEGETGYACLGDGDCHLIVAHWPTQRLYEMWRANMVGDAFEGGCLAVWDMSRLYPPGGRGEQCTSADAAGYPIAPLLFTADEVASGWIDHAIRFILPNARIRDGVYVHPATHSTSAASGGVHAPPYGTRLRLRADYPLESLPNPGARVVARAMQRFGLLLADGGNIALTARSDRFTTAKWSGLLGPHDLRDLQVTDFIMVEAGARLPYTGDCVRLP